MIACDSRGFAGLVTSRNFESLRAMNFGLRCLAETTTVERCLQEIGRYDPDDASQVANSARADADLSKLLDQFEKLYDEVLTGVRRPAMTAEARERAVARFLHENLPRRPRDARWPWLVERENFQRELESLAHKAGALTDRLDACNALARIRDAEIAEHEALARAHNDLIGERDALARVRDAEIAEHEALVRAYNDLITERDAIARVRNAEIAEHEALVRAHNDLIAERDAIARTYRCLIIERDALAHDRNGVVVERDTLLASHSWRLTAPLRWMRKLFASQP